VLTLSTNSQKEKRTKKEKLLLQQLYPRKLLHKSKGTLREKMHFTQSAQRNPRQAHKENTLYSLYR